MKRQVILFSFWLCILLCTSALPQYSAGFAPSGGGLPAFLLKVFSTFSQDTGESSAKIIVQFVNDNLTFVKSDSGYEAEVQIEYYMTEKEHDYVFNRTVNHKVFTNNYSDTESRKEVNTFYTEMPVSPGKYEVAVTAFDKNNSKQFNQTAKFEVADTATADKRFVVSDFLFFSDYEADAEGHITQFNPELTQAFSTDKKFIYVYFNSFTFNENDSILIKYQVKDDRGIIITQNQYITTGKSKFLEHFIKLNRYYFNRNKYIMELFANAGEQWIVKNTAFAFFWRFSPNSIQDLDLAMDQLKYIAENDSVKYYKKASFEEKKKFFERFWAERDPNPDTEENELMDEYYRRVNFANTNFASSGVEGWLSDRGRIFIKFGEPDEIERHPFDAQSYPYQIWRYFSVQKVFLFIDRTGFGDYDLHPSYYYVEYE
jgi:GWxTD domain-containing protein